MAKALRLNFTLTSLKSLPIPELGQRQVYHDEKVDGLELRVTHTGVKSFSVYKRIQGRMERITLGRFPEMTVEQARKAAQQALGAIATGANPAEFRRGKRREMSLQDLFDEYMARKAVLNKRPDKPQDIFRLHLQGWANRKLSTIRHEEVDRLHKKIGKERGESTANSVLKLLHVMFNQAITVWRIYQGDNPAHGIPKFKEKSRDRFLQSDEVPRFFQALAAEGNPIMRDFFLISLLTGARKSNVLEMRWSQISFERSEWLIPDTKNGEPQVVTLAPEALEILQERKRLAETGNPFVFPGRPRRRPKPGEVVEPQPLKEVKTGWKRILKRAGIEEGDLRVHDLRRSLGSWQARTGASLSVIGKSLNHKSISTTAIYARLDLDPVRQSVNTAAAALYEAAGVKDCSLVSVVPNEKPEA